LIKNLLEPEMLRFLQGKKILITGASGFIGQALSSILYSTDSILACSSRHSTTTRLDRRFEKKILTHHYDANRGWSTLPFLPDIVFFLSGQTNVDFSFEHPYQDFCANVSAIAQLCDYLKGKHSDATIILSGTITQVGIPSTQEIGDDTEDNPITFYDFHKSIAESVLKYYGNAGLLNTVTLRLPNVYGPGAKSRNSGRGVLNKVIQKFVDNEPVTIFGSGKELREYIFIEDVIRSLLVSARDVRSLSGSSYLISGGSAVTVAEAFSLARECVLERLGRATSITYLAEHALSPIEKRSYAVDSSTFSQKTGWLPRWPLREGIFSTIDSLLSDK